MELVCALWAVVHSQEAGTCGCSFDALYWSLSPTTPPGVYSSTEGRMAWVSDPSVPAFSSMKRTLTEASLRSAMSAWGENVYKALLRC